MDIINKRRSVRKFKDIDISNDVIEELLRAGMQAPSAKNQQPWVFLVVKEKDTLNQLVGASNLFLKCKAAIFLFIDSNTIEPIMANADMGACTQNILLKSVDLGLGTCWIGTEGKENRIKIFKEVLNIPGNLRPFSAIVLGYPEEENDNYYIDRYNKSKVFFERF